MIVVNRLRKTPCILLPVLICFLTISANAQDSNSPSSVEDPAPEVQGLETASTLENSTGFITEEDPLQANDPPSTSAGESETNMEDDNIAQSSSNDSVINESASTSQLWTQLENYKNHPSFYFALTIALTAILTFVVYLWQLFFGVPDWLVTTQEVEEKNEETTEFVEAHNVETQQGIADDVAIELAVQVWRLEKRVGQLDLNDSPKLLRRMTDSVDKFKQLLHDNKVIVDDPVNRKYVDGWLEVKAIAWEEVPLEKCPDNIGADPFVLETIRPIVRRDGRPISIGQIVVAECEGNKII